MRKILRDRLRKEVGNRGLKDAWESRQKKKYGKAYFEVCRRHNRDKGA